MDELETNGSEAKYASSQHNDLRRTAVRNLERAGVPRTIAMKLTGHKTESIYRRYDIVSPNDLQVAAQLLGDCSVKDNSERQGVGGVRAAA